MPDAIAAQLDALFAAPERVTVAGRRVAVRGVWLGELAEFMRLYAAKPADDAAMDSPAAAAWSADIVAMLSRLSGEPEDWLFALADEELDQLFGAMWQANRILFEPGAGVRQGPRGAREQFSWATAAALLIEAGHRHDQIERYTLAQIEQYRAAHVRLAADRRLEALSLARAAQADQKGYRNVLRTLEQARARLGS